MAPSDATIIAVMGVTGVGKSTFIKYATGCPEGIVISDGLESCTAEVTMYQIPSTQVFLLDTPGFDDTYKNDTEILDTVARFLEEIFEDARSKLKGIIYLHAITEPKMKGSSMRNLRMFRKMIGDNNMSKCCLVTTKWSLQSKGISIAREEELLRNPQFWQPIYALGAAIARFGDSTQSARDIVDPLLTHGHFVTKLTEQYTIEKRPLGQTEAGQEVRHVLSEAEREHKKEIEQLKRDSGYALFSENQELAAVLDADRARLEEELESMRADRRLLDQKREQENRDWEEKVSAELGKYQESLDKQREGQRIKEIRRQARKGRWRARAFGAGCVAIAYMTGGAALPIVSLAVLGGIEGILQAQKKKEIDEYGLTGIPV